MKNTLNISFDLLKREDLTSSEKILYAYLLNKQEALPLEQQSSSEQRFEKQSSIGKALSFSTRTINSAALKLQEKGLIEIQKENVKGSLFRNVYVVKKGRFE